MRSAKAALRRASATVACDAVRVSKPARFQRACRPSSCVFISRRRRGVCRPARPEKAPEGGRHARCEGSRICCGVSRVSRRRSNGRPTRRLARRTGLSDPRGLSKALWGPESARQAPSTPSRPSRTAGRRTVADPRPRVAHGSPSNQRNHRRNSSSRWSARRAVASEECTPCVRGVRAGGWTGAFDASTVSAPNIANH